jgi:hypothetical protein
MTLRSISALAALTRAFEDPQAGPIERVDPSIVHPPDLRAGFPDAFRSMPFSVSG